MVASHSKQRHNFAPEAINAPHEGKSYLRNQDHSPYQIYHPITGRGWWLKPGENTVGRGFHNDIVLTDISVSRHHASIYVDGPYIYVKDNGSTNGVFVAGEQVKNSPLTLDCIFKLGKVELAVIKPAVDDSSHQSWTMVWD